MIFYIVSILLYLGFGCMAAGVVFSDHRPRSWLSLIFIVFAWPIVYLIGLGKLLSEVSANGAKR